MKKIVRQRGIALGLAACTLALGVNQAAAATPTPTPTASATATPKGSATPTPTATASAMPTAMSIAKPAAAPTVAPAATGTLYNSATMDDPRCAATKPLTIFSINDYHGGIATGSGDKMTPSAPAYFTPYATLKQAQPDTMLLSAGDNIGASLFVSSSQDDMPTLKVLNAAGLIATAPGNHEFDQGWAKLRDTYIPASTFTYVSSNIEGTNLADYMVYTTPSGIRVAVIGATRADFITSVDPSGVVGITTSPEVAAVNKTADAIAAGGLADVIVAEIHNEFQDGFNANVHVIFNGDTHNTYANTTPLGQPVMQAGTRGASMSQAGLTIGAGNVVCGTPTGQVIQPAATADLSIPMIATIDQITRDAITQAQAIGSQPIGNSCGPITRGMKTDGSMDNREVESTLTNLIAQSNADGIRTKLGLQGVIGVQNPGGTRADLPGGVVTYADAGTVLPFNNTIATMQISGAEFKTMLEQQWQRDAAGVPSTKAGKQFAALGLSNNVSYTYDESKPMDQRITSVTVNGAPLDPAATYTIAGASFLIKGGDNFHVLDAAYKRFVEQGQGHFVDTGFFDVAFFSDWFKATSAAGTICPSPAMRGVSVSDIAPITCSATSTFTVGLPLGEAPLAKDTLNYTNGVPADTTVTAFADGAEIGSFPVTDGVATIALQAPAGGEGGALTLVSANGTQATVTGTTVDACPIPEAQITEAKPEATSNTGSLAATGGPALAFLIAGLVLVTGGAAMTSRKK